MTKPGITVSLSSGFHPQSNGQIERVNQEIGRYLRSYCSNNQNSLRHSATNLTPFHCSFGTPTTWDHQQWTNGFGGVNRCGRAPTKRVNETCKREADKSRSKNLQYKPGNRVWLSTRDLKLSNSCKKLNPRYIGPFKILKQINPVSFRLELPAHYKVNLTFHVSLLKPSIQGPLYIREML